MTTTLAFLRAINVGKRRFPAADIVRVVSGLGATGVETHSSTGNVRLAGLPGGRAAVESALEVAFEADRGFEVPVIAFTPEEFRDVLASVDELADDGLARHYVYLLKRELTPTEAAAVEAKATDAGRMVVRGRAAHALLLPGYQDGVVDPLNAARLLGAATNRNANVIRTLAAKWT